MRVNSNKTIQCQIDRGKSTSLGFVSSFQNMDGSHNEFCKFIESSREYSTTFIREIASILGGPSWKSVHPSPCIVVTLFLG